MVNGDFISKVVERAKVACYRFEGAAPHAVVLYFPLETFLIDAERVSKEEERMCIVLHWIAHYYTLEHCGA